MKLPFHTLAIAAALSAGGAQAANITWSIGPAFNGPNGHQGILTNGALVEAANLNHGGSPANIVVDPAGLNISFSSVNSPFFGGSWSSAGGAGNTDAGWASILTTFEWSIGSNVVAANFLSGLTVGNVYQVQLFAGRSDCCSRTHWYGDGNGNFSAAKGDNSYLSAVGLFTADATSQTIEFFDSTRNPYLNAYVLRDLTPPVPEPSTYALLLAGLAGVAAVARRRRPS